MCKRCVNAYHVARRESCPVKKKQHHTYVRANIDRLVEEMNNIKDRPCEDCGGRFNAWQMQFDHVTGEKLDNVSTLARNGSTNLFRKEVKKCDVVCANCHADRTYWRNQECRG